MVIPLVAVLFWGVLLLALSRGAFVIPTPGVVDVLKRTLKLALIAGFPVTLLMGLGAGQLTSMFPPMVRLKAAALVSLLSMPFYSMVIAVTVVQHGQWPRTPAGAGRGLSWLAIVISCGLATLFTLSVLMIPAGPFMG